MFMMVYGADQSNGLSVLDCDDGSVPPQDKCTIIVFRS